MSGPRNARAPKAPSPHWSVPESADQQEERDVRVAEMMARARKHPPKAGLRHSDARRIVHLIEMLHRLERDYRMSFSSPAPAEHLADAILDLEVMIVRAILFAGNATSAPQSETDHSCD